MVDKFWHFFVQRNSLKSSILFYQFLPCKVMCVWEVRVKIFPFFSQEKQPHVLVFLPFLWIQPIVKWNQIMRFCHYQLFFLSVRLYIRLKHCWCSSMFQLHNLFYYNNCEFCLHDSVEYWCFALRVQALVKINKWTTPRLIRSICCEQALISWFIPASQIQLLWWEGEFQYTAATSGATVGVGRHH